MQRNTNLEEVLFPVGLTEIYHSVPNHPQQAALFGEQSDRSMHKIHRFLAITNLQNGHVYSVVTDGYRLVTNQEAIELAEHSFQQLFGEENTSQMDVYNIYTSQSRSYCQIDFIHRNYALNLGAREIWLPFLRVTNSYNRTRALSFDLGFCRAVCSNGVIFERDTIRYKFLHTNQKISPAGRFQVDFKRLKSMEADFQNSVQKWMAYPIPHSAYFPLVCLALQLKFDIHSIDPERQMKEKRRLAEVQRDSASLIDAYCAELGENAYSVLGVVTEIASRPPKPIAPASMMDILQKRAGNWFRDFSLQIQEPNFHLDFYLREVINWFE